MSSADAQRTEVLRGMQIEANPVRLGRGRVPAQVGPPEVEACPGASAAEEALLRGFEEGVQQGRAEGLRAGYEEGRRKGQAEAAAQARAGLEKAISEALLPMQEEQERLRSLAMAVEAAMAECISAAEDELVALSYETICRIIGTAAVQPAVVQAHLTHLLSLVKSGQATAMHVHPQDAALLERSGTVIGQAASGEQRLIRWVADPEVALGGCVVVRKGGGLDARLETVLAGCKAALLEARASRAAVAGSGT